MNKTEIKLSIIIPVYNGEKNIQKCLNSIFCQKGELLPYEVIIVNDGSTDNSLSLISSLIADKNHISLVTQPNAGAGAARNNGMKHANGDFLFFIDSDDYIHENCLSTIFKALQNDVTTNVLLIGYEYFNAKENIYKKMAARDTAVFNDNFYNKNISINECPQLIECIQYPWNKIFNKKFVNDFNLLFSETRVQNDLFFSMASLVCAKSVKILPDVLYVHVVQQAEQISKIGDERRLDSLTVFEQLDEFILGKLPSHQHLLSYYAFKVALVNWIISISSNKIRFYFISYLNSFINSLDDATVEELMQHPLAYDSVKKMIANAVHRKKCLATTTTRPLLSIIIPVYNVEPWLSGCLKSVADQILSPDLYEVILVNDKSTDGSLGICHDFCSKYSNFRLIDLTEHTVGGAGIPSNIGIDNAKGDYIGFVDSDDYIEPDMFDSLLLKAIQTKADLTICGFSIFNENTQTIEPAYDLGSWRKFLANFDKTSLPEKQRKALKISPVPWRKLYRKDFLNKFHIRYPEGDYFFEDNPLHWYAVLQASSFAVVDKQMITHRMARTGQTMSSNPEKFLAFGIHIKTIYKFLLTSGKYEEFKLDFLRYVMSQNHWLLPKLGSYHKPYLANVREACKNFTLNDFAVFYKKRNFSRIYLAYNYMLIHSNYTTALVVEKLLRYLAKLKPFYHKIKNKLNFS